MREDVSQSFHSKRLGRAAYLRQLLHLGWQGNVCFPALTYDQVSFPCFLYGSSSADLFPSPPKKRLITGCPCLFSELSQRPRVYITCTAFLASLYILVFQACHLWPHSTCPLLDTPLVFHNHNLHPAPRSCCHSTNHCYELVIRYRILYQLFSGADIENLCREVRDVNYVHCQRIRGAIGLIVLNT